MESYEPGYETARAHFRQAAGRISLAMVRITVVNPRAIELAQFIPLLRIQNVGQFVVRLDSVGPDKKDEQHELLDRLNQRGIKATGPGYTYRPLIRVSQGS